jgi:hypothetical protein
MPRDVSVAELIAANPSFEQQMREWQNERHQKDDDPFDWQAFRDLETYIGAPDPGEAPPPEFFWFIPAPRRREVEAVRAETLATVPFGGTMSADDRPI